MTNKIYYALIGLILILLFTTLYLYQSTTCLTNKLETLGNNFEKHIKCNSKDSVELAVQQFKEDSYIRQQEHDTNLILTTFAAIIGLVAFFTYRASKEEISLIDDRFTTKINNIVSKQDTEYHKKIKHVEDFIEDTRKQINYEAFLSRRVISDNAFRENNLAMYVFIGLSGLTYYVGYYNYFLKHDPNNVEHYLENIKSDLNSILKRIPNPFVISTSAQKIEKENVQGALNAILSINHPEIKELVLKIQSRLQYS